MPAKKQEKQMSLRERRMAAKEPEILPKEKQAEVSPITRKEASDEKHYRTTLELGPDFKRLMEEVNVHLNSVATYLAQLANQPKPGMPAPKADKKVEAKPAPAAKKEEDRGTCESCGEKLTRENSSKNSTGYVHIGCPAEAENGGEDPEEAVEEEAGDAAAEAEEKPEPVTFDMLRDAAIKFATANGKEKLVEVLKTFHPDGKLSAIPEEKRADFLQAVSA